ncbi:MAG: nickel-responsive transcriptional regulator NikR [candidate division WOR-3 bacterium]
MTKLKRFSVSLDRDLVSKFDKEIKKKNYPTRSKAIGDLIREYLVKKEWIEGKEVIGAIILIYNHHKRELVNKLLNIEHHFHKIIISSQHVHLDENNCLEIVITRGKPKDIEKLSNKLKSTKGVKYSSLNIATTGKEI